MDNNRDREELITPSIARGLNDKVYDKRKNAALELEHLVRSLRTGGDSVRVARIIATLRRDFAQSGNPNSRKGGIIGLAAVAIALSSVRAARDAAAVVAARKRADRAWMLPVAGDATVCWRWRPL